MICKLIKQDYRKIEVGNKNTLYYNKRWTNIM